MNPLRFVVVSVLTLLAGGLAAAEDKPAPKEPTAEQLEKVIAESRQKRFAFYRPGVDPFTGKPTHGFRLFLNPKDFPAIPFAYEIIISAPDEQAGLEAFAAAKPVPAVRLRLDPNIAIDWKKLKGVESLTINSARPPARDLVQLQSLTTLVGLFVEADLKELKQLKNLKNLTVRDVGDAGLKELSEFPALERVLISNSFKKQVITQEGFKSLQKLKNLKQLGIYDHPDGFSPEAVAELAKLKGLTHLRLTKIGRMPGFPLLESLDSLTTLELSDVAVASGDVRPSKFKSLHTLRITGDPLDHDLFKDLKNAKGLKCLSLSGRRVDDKDLESLQGLPLEKLYLIPTSTGTGTRREWNFSGVGVARAVKGMKTLTTLDIQSIQLFPPVPKKGDFGDNPFDRPSKKDDPPKKAPAPEITDDEAKATQKQRAEIIAALQGLPKLRSLNVRRTGLKDEDVAWLGKIKSLHYLYLDDKISLEGLDRLKKDLPNCTIAKFLEFSEQVGNEPAK